MRPRSRPGCARRASTAPSLPRPRPWTSTPDAALSTTIPSRAIENLACDSPLGDGRIHFAGDLPGDGSTAALSVELDRIPVAAGLDALRTVRNGLVPVWRPGARSAARLPTPRALPGEAIGKNGAEWRTQAESALRSSAGRAGAAHRQLHRGRLSTERGRAEPADPDSQAGAGAGGGAQGQQPGQSQFPGARGHRGSSRRRSRSPHGYHPAGSLRLPDDSAWPGCSHAGQGTGACGRPVGGGGSGRAGWRPSHCGPERRRAVVANTDDSVQRQVPPAGSGTQPGADDAATDRLSGTLTLHNANWKAGYLANHVEIYPGHAPPGQRRAALGPGDLLLRPGERNGEHQLPSRCEAPQPCIPHLEVQFGALDASTVQSAFLGAREPGTLLSTLIAGCAPRIDRPRRPGRSWRARQRPTPSSWGRSRFGRLRPRCAFFRTELKSEPRCRPAGRPCAWIRHSAHRRPIKASPPIRWRAGSRSSAPPAVGQLLGLRWSGGALRCGTARSISPASPDSELAASAKGALHFEWHHGAIAAGPATVPPALARFDLWTADAEIANGLLTLKENQVKRGSRTEPVQASITLADPPRIAFPAPKPTLAKR
jgi:hypothetical protein